MQLRLCSVSTYTCTAVRMKVQPRWTTSGGGVQKQEARRGGQGCHYEEITQGDLEECGELFLDAKASAKLLTEQADKYLS